MHAANIKKSKRLQNVLKVLSDGQWHSTREIMFLANVLAVNSCVNELRANGIDYECKCLGVGRFVYRICGVEHANNPV